MAYLRLALLGCVCACVIACSSKTSSQPTASPAPATAARTSAAVATRAPVLPQTVIFLCDMGPNLPRGAVVRPPEIVFACADAGAGVRRLVWRDWGTPRAVATGVRYQNDCVPYCAQGHFHEYPARIVAFTPGVVAGRRAYTRLEVTTFGEHPTYIKPVERYDLAANGPRGPQ